MKSQLNWTCLLSALAKLAYRASVRPFVCSSDATYLHTERSVSLAISYSLFFLVKMAATDRVALLVV